MICIKFPILIAIPISRQYSTYPHPSGLLHWHWGNRMIAPEPVKQPWGMWVNKTYQSSNNNDYNQSLTKHIHVHISWHMGHITGPSLFQIITGRLLVLYNVYLPLTRHHAILNVIYFLTIKCSTYVQIFNDIIT